VAPGTVPAESFVPRGSDTLPRTDRMGSQSDRQLQNRTDSPEATRRGLLLRTVRALASRAAESGAAALPLLPQDPAPDPGHDPCLDDNPERSDIRWIDETS